MNDKPLKLRFIRPRRLHRVPATAYILSGVVALSFVSLSVCRSAVCWSRPRALQKRMNRPRCRFGEGQTRVSLRNYVLNGSPDSPCGRTLLRG